MGVKIGGEAFLCCTADLSLDVFSVWLLVMPGSPISTSYTWNFPLETKVNKFKLRETSFSQF